MSTHHKGASLTGPTGKIITTDEAERVQPAEEQTEWRLRGKQFKRYVRLARLPDDGSFHRRRSVTLTQRYAHLAPGVMLEAMKATFGDL